MVISLYSLICLWTLFCTKMYQRVGETMPCGEVYIRVDDMRRWGVLDDCDYREFLERDHEENILLIETLSPSLLHVQTYYDIYDFVVYFNDQVHSEEEFIPFLETLSKGYDGSGRIVLHTW